MDIKHPAYELDRGVPSRATVGDTDYTIDDDGYIPDGELDDESDAVQVMAQLASTYGVTYDDDGEIEAESAPDTPGSDDEDGVVEADESDESDGEAGDTLSQDELQTLDRDELRERCRDNDAVDVEAINLNQTDEMVAALMRAQTEAVDGEGDG